MTTPEKRAIEDLRNFAELLIKTNMLDLRTALEQPQASMVNILTRNTTELSDLNEDDRNLMRSQALQNALSSMRNRMEKVVRDVNLYEQVIRISDNLLHGKYGYDGLYEKPVSQEITSDENNT